jgi:uncharacterized membrane protein
MGIKLSSGELLQAQAALFIAIGLQLLVRSANHELLLGPQILIIPIEVCLVLLVSLMHYFKTLHQRTINHFASIGLLGLLSVANMSSLLLVLTTLIVGGEEVNGINLLVSAIAIFLTNIIVFALWYWEIDSPGLTLRKWSKNDKDFHFLQQAMSKDFPNWRPEFFDYIYLSLTNAINFAPADTRPITRQAKLLMSVQALISVFTLALVVARSVSILGT